MGRFLRVPDVVSDVFPYVQKHVEGGKVRKGWEREGVYQYTLISV